MPDPRGEVVNFLAPFKGWLDSVNVDSVGVGYNFATHLKDRGYRVHFVNVGQSSRYPDKFANLKAQLYWSLRERFEAGEVAGLTDELTIAQLASIRYEYNPRGQVAIESKDDARKRGVKSPDRAEAIMLAFAQMTPGIMTYYRREALGTLVRQGRSVEEIAEQWKKTPEQIQSWIANKTSRPRPTADDPDGLEIFHGACKPVEP